MAPNGSENSNEEGNTSPRSHDAGARISPSKYWAFTSFELNRDEIEEAWRDGAVKYIIGLEKCPKTGKKHLQGFVKFDKKCRPLETWKKLKISHWEKCKGGEDANVKYCSKEGDYVQKGFDKYFDLWDEEILVGKLKKSLEDKYGDYNKEYIKQREGIEHFVALEVLQYMYTRKKVKIISNQTRLKDYVRHLLRRCIKTALLFFEF